MEVGLRTVFEIVRVVVVGEGVPDVVVIVVVGVAVVLVKLVVLVVVIVARSTQLFLCLQNTYSTKLATCVLTTSSLPFNHHP